VKRHWLERQNGFAGAVHRFDLFLKSAGGAGRAELAEGVYQDWYDVGVCRCNVTNVADKAAAAHAQANGPDTDNIIGRSDVVAGSIAQGRVVEAGSVLERVSTDGRVVEVGCNGIGYANFYSRSHDAVIRVYDAAGNVIETHEYVGEVKRAVKFATNRDLSAAAPPFGSFFTPFPPSSTATPSGTTFFYLERRAAYRFYLRASPEHHRASLDSSRRIWDWKRVPPDMLRG